MKKIYLMPAMQINEAQVVGMMAISLQNGNADTDKEVLTKENDDWNIWEE
ncbi:MAG: hypothetical protein IKW91_09985 [Bacteroidaceae bacterium]|nr:hypothetical protein [Bacteroidaceae bacterium]